MENKSKQQWVFVPLMKKHIIKRTDSYVLFSVNEKASAIVSAKFVRAKESEEFIYLSLPEDYEVSWRVNAQAKNNKWVVVNSGKMSTKELREKVLAHNKDEEEQDEVLDTTDDAPF